MSAAVLNAFAREVPYKGTALVFADLDLEFCIKELALLNEGLPNIQCCIYSVLIVPAFILIPSYSLKTIPEGFEVVVADWGVDLLSIGGVGHSDWLGVLTPER